MAPRYPLSITEERQLPQDYEGNVFTWDIDKTYLATNFSSMGGLARIPIEFAVDKAGIAGMSDVLRGLRRGAGPSFAAAPLYFVSSSPPQLRRVIQHKMLIDGVQPDGFIFKNWLGTLKQLRPGRLKDHVGYKLCALLHWRQARPLCTEFLFGDDVERDAETYSLYASLLSGDLGLDALQGALVTSRVAPDDRLSVVELAATLPKRLGRVRRIFIHLARGTPPRDLTSYSPLITPVQNACQLALALHEMGLVDRDAALQAAGTVRKAMGSRARFDETLDDAVQRRLIKNETLLALGL